MGAIALAAVDDAAALAFWTKDKAPHYGDAAHRHPDWLGIDYAAAMASGTDHGWWGGGGGGLTALSADRRPN